MIRFEDTFTLCRLPPQHVVCGLELEPLTLGHAGILDSLGLWDAVEPQDIILAAFICSRPSWRFAEDLRGGGFRLRWHPLRISGGLKFRLRFWAWRLGRRWDYEKSRKCWHDYILTHTDLPFMQPRGKARDTNVPRLEVIRALLLSHLNYSPETIEDTRYSRAVHDFNGYLEQEDVARMLNATRIGVKAALTRN